MEVGNGTGRLVERDPAFGGETCQGGGEAFDGCRRRALEGVDQMYLMAGQGCDLGDARTHRPSADNRDGNGVQRRDYGHPTHGGRPRQSLAPKA